MARWDDKGWDRLIGSNTAGLRDLTRVIEKNRDAFASVSNKIVDSFNSVGRLTEVISRSETLQLRALSLGTTYSKFVANNTKALEDTKSSTMDMTEALMGAYSLGLRRNTQELDSLIDTMEFLGQDSSILAGAMADVSLYTKESKSVQKNLIQSLENTTKDYGVATDTLVKGLNSLSKHMAKFSIYGEETVGRLGELKTAILGRTGGKGDELANTFIDALDLTNIQQQAVLGIEDTVKSFWSGDSMDKVLETLTKDTLNLDRNRLSDDKRTRGYQVKQYGPEIVQALLNLQVYTKDYNKLTSQEKKDNEAYRDTLKNKSVYVDKFYQTYAPEMHGAITRVLPAYFAMKAGGVAIGGLKTVRGNAKRTALASLRAKRKAVTMGLSGPARTAALATAKLGTSVGKLAMVASIIPRIHPIGIALTAAGFLLPEILSVIQGIGKSNEKSTEELEKINKRDSYESNPDSALSIATRVAMSTTFGNKADRDKVVNKLEELIVLQKINNTILKGKPSTPNTPVEHK